MQVTKAGIERIKASNELSAVVAERGIEVKRKGRHLVASCPFHEEEEASFTITPGKGLYHCFGCGAAGDVIGFVTKHDKVSFGAALDVLAKRAGLTLSKLMEDRPRVLPKTPLEALTPPNGNGSGTPHPIPPPRQATALLARVVDHYHKTFCERADAQEYLKKRGLTDPDILRAFKVGYADGSLLKLIPKEGSLREDLLFLGVVTEEDRELLGGCIVVPIPDPLTGEWTTLYGRGMRTSRHCYLPGPLRGVLNFQAAKASEEVILAESILDALSFHHAGIFTAIPIYGTSGFTPDHLDLLKRERVKRVILALDGDAAGRKATAVMKDKLTSLGIAVRVMPYPPNLKDPNEVLVSRNGDAGEVFCRLLSEAEPRPGTERTPPLRERPESNETPGAAGEAVRRCHHEAEPRQASPGPDPALSGAGAVPAAQVPPAVDSVSSLSSTGQLVLVRDGVTYRARVQAPLLGRLRATVRVEREDPSKSSHEGRDTCTAAARFHVDTLDLYASRSRSEFGKRAAKVLGIEAEPVESALLALLVEAEKVTDQDAAAEVEAPAPMSEAEREEARGFLRHRDLLDQVVRDAWALGFVGEEANIKLLFLIANSRRSAPPLSALILSPSGAGKSGITEVIELLTPPEDVVLFTRLTPQSLYYTEPGYLDKKLVIIEERHGSQEADYSVRVLQSRGKLIAAAPVKDPQTGNLRTKVFTVEARCAFIEATTASSVNHENATRCFELTMDESPEQTRRIHERQRLMKTERGLELRQEAAAITRRHWNAQRLLESLPVVIPFADQLTFPDTWMRTRRDHARFLNLIEVSAFLHQYQRERRGGSRSGEAIVASVEDYQVAYALAASVLAETLSDVRKPLREAYERIRELSLKGDGTVSRREIREALSEPDSTVRRWLAELVELEYLFLVGGESGKLGQGKAVRYRPAERPPEPCEIAGLLSPAELTKRLKG